MDPTVFLKGNHHSASFMFKGIREVGKGVQYSDNAKRVVVFKNEQLYLCNKMVKLVNGAQLCRAVLTINHFTFTPFHLSNTKPSTLQGEMECLH